MKDILFVSMLMMWGAVSGCDSVATPPPSSTEPSPLRVVSNETVTDPCTVDFRDSNLFSDIVPSETGIVLAEAWHDWEACPAATSPNGRVRHYDGRGNLISEMPSPFPNAERFEALVGSQGGFFYVYHPTFREKVVSWVTTDNDVVWTRPLPTEDLEDVVRIRRSGVSARTESLLLRVGGFDERLIRIGSDGTLDWDVSVDHMNLARTNMSAAEADDGRLVVATGGSGGTSGRGIDLVQIGRSGDVLWTADYDSPYEWETLVPEHIQFLPNGQILMLAKAAGFNFGNLVAVVLNGDGSVAWRAQTSPRSDEEAFRTVRAVGPTLEEHLWIIAEYGTKTCNPSCTGAITTEKVLLDMEAREFVRTTTPPPTSFSGYGTYGVESSRYVETSAGTWIAARQYGETGYFRSGPQFRFWSSWEVRLLVLNEE